jgi:outer membrane protein assembly factor BamA
MMRTTGRKAVLAGLLAVAPVAAGAQKAHEGYGWRPTAVPVINFSSDDGTGFGVRVNLYEYDGASVPYRRKYSAQAFATTGGKWVHRLLLDAPQIRPNERLEAELVYEKEEFANYYGGLSDEAVAGYSRDQRTFRQAFPEFKVKWIRALRAPWRLRLGGRLSHNSIEPNAASGSILSALDPLGAAGGVFVQLNGALRYDTRDNYNDASAGFLQEIMLDVGLGGGGDYRGAQLSWVQRHFRGFVGGLVLALRTRMDWTLGDLPFYEELNLGGSSTVRGVASARDRGEARILLNGELRWRGLPLWRRQQLYLGGVAFGDIGQIFARDSLPAGGAWRRGGGLGLRCHWHSTIVRADYGVSGGRRAIYVTFAQLF